MCAVVAVWTGRACQLEAAMTLRPWRLIERLWKTKSIKLSWHEVTKKSGFPKRSQGHLKLRAGAHNQVQTRAGHLGRMIR